MENIELGPLTVYPFGIFTAAALLAAVLWSVLRAKKDGQLRTLEYFFLFAIPAGLVFSRLAFCLADYDNIPDSFLETAVDLAAGGYLLYGALAGAALALWIACRLTHASFGETADRIAPPFLLFNALLIVGEGLVGRGYGWKVTDWFSGESGMSLFRLEDVSFFSRLPFAVVDSYYGYASWAVWIPAAAAVGLFALLAARRGKREALAPGAGAVLAGSLYAAFRVLYESLRQDDIPKWGFVRVNQILSAVFLMILLLACVFRLRKAGDPSWKKRLGSSLGIFFAGITLGIVVEFALEKKISFLEWMPMDVCYVVMFAGCMLLFRSCERLRKPAFDPRLGR